MRLHWLSLLRLLQLLELLSNLSAATRLRFATGGSYRGLLVLGRRMPVLVRGPPIALIIVNKDYNKVQDKDVFNIGVNYRIADARLAQWLTVAEAGPRIDGHAFLEVRATGQHNLDKNFARVDGNWLTVPILATTATATARCRLTIRLLPRRPLCPRFGAVSYAFTAPAPDLRRRLAVVGRLSTAPTTSETSSRGGVKPAFTLVASNNAAASGDFDVESTSGAVLMLNPAPRPGLHRLRVRVHGVGGDAPCGYSNDGSISETGFFSEADVTIVVAEPSSVDSDGAAILTAAVTLGVVRPPLVTSWSRAGATYALVRPEGGGLMTAAPGRIHLQLVDDYQGTFQLVPPQQASESAGYHQLQLARNLQTADLGRTFDVRIAISNVSVESVLIDPSDRRLLSADIRNRNFRLTVQECTPVGALLYRFRPSFYDEALAAEEAATGRGGVERLRRLLMGPESRFEFIEWQSSKQLRLERGSGAVTIRSPMDAESTAGREQRLIARIRDLSAPSHVTFHTLLVSVSDCNEFAPSLVGGQTVSVSLPESAPVGRLVATLNLTDDDADADKDGEAAATLVAMSMDSSALSPFHLDESGRRLLLARPLDLETQSGSYSVRLRLTDRGRPFPRVSMATVSVTVLPVNEFAPEFEHAVCRFDVDFFGSRNRRLFSTGPLEAVDLDEPPEPVSYLLLGAPSCAEVAIATGNVTLNLDCLRQHNLSRLSLLMVAKDADGRVSPYPLSLEFNSASASPWQQKRHKRCDKPASGRSRRPAAVAAANRRARDDHRRRLADAVSSNAAVKSLPNRPPVIFWSVADGDVRSTRVIALPEDADAGTVVADFPVDDPDDADWYNGHLPAFAATVALSSDSNESQNSYDFAFNASVKELCGDDHDDDDSESRARRFFSRCRRRVLRLVVAEPLLLDRERRPSYGLKLKVCDAGSPPLCSSIDVGVQLADVNDNRPAFLSPTSNLTVSSAPTLGVTLHRFAAVDPDLGDNGTVRFRLLLPDAPEAALFSLDAVSGELRFADNATEISDGLGRDFELEIQAFDLGRPSLTSSLRVRVDFNIRPDDRRRLKFVTGDVDQPGKLSLRLNEMTPPGALLANLLAVGFHSNRPPAGGVAYSLSGLPAVVGQFSLDRRTGCLSLGRRHRLSASTSPYRLFAVAEALVNDEEDKKIRAELFIIVDVVAAPNLTSVVRFRWPAIALNAAESLPVGSLIGRPPELRVWRDGNDKEAAADTGELGNVRYEILHDDGGWFAIDSDGNIETRTPLDREATPAGLWLSIRATAASAGFSSGLSNSSGGGSSSEFSTADCLVFVNIVDVNDCRPVASEAAHYRVRVVEDAPAGLELLPAVPAEDGDSLGEGSRSGVRFSLIGGNKAGHFRVDSGTGRLTTTNSSIDHEVDERFLLTLSIADEGSPPLSSHVQIEVEVADVNDSPPQFVASHFYLVAFAGMAPLNWTRALELMPPGAEHWDQVPSAALSAAAPSSFVSIGARLPALDFDSAPNAVTAYSLASSSGGAAAAEPPPVLSVDNGTAELRVRLAALLAAGGAHSTLVLARDAASSEVAGSASAPVRLELTGRPPPPPTPESELFDLLLADGRPEALREDSRPGSSVPGVLAVPRLGSGGRGPIVFYLAGAGSSDFYLPQSGGRLVLIRRLNYSRQRLYNLTLAAWNGWSISRKLLTVTVQPINRWCPKFDQPAYHRRLPMRRGSRQPVIRVSASDPDPGPLGSLQYSVQAAAQASSLSLFSIDPLTGQVWRLANRDGAVGFVRRRVHWLLLRVADSFMSLEDRRHGYAWLRIDEQWAAATAPNGDDASRPTDVAEVPARAPVGYPVWAPATGDGRFRIESDSSRGLFSIDPASGLVAVAASTEGTSVAKSYSLTLLSETAANATRRFRLNVSILADTRPQNRSRLAVSLAVQPSEFVGVDEDAPAGTFVARVVAEGALDAASLVFALSNCSASTGWLLGYFGIGPSSGVVTTSRSGLDRDTVGSGGQFMLTAIATSAAGSEPALSAEVRIRVTIRDINDNRPRWKTPPLPLPSPDGVEEPMLHGWVPEDVPVGGAVLLLPMKAVNSTVTVSYPRPLRLLAEDADSGENGDIEYEVWTDGYGEQTFYVDEDSGVLRVRRPLDRELTDRHELWIRARDRGRPRRLRSHRAVRVRVEVADVDDTPPKFLYPKLSTASVVLELPTYPGARVARVRLADPDVIGSPPTLTLASAVLLSEGDTVRSNADGSFSVDRQSGSILTAPGSNGSLLRPGRYRLCLTASDSRHVVETNVTVDVGAPGSPPLLLHQAGRVEARVDESAPVGHVIGQPHPWPEPPLDRPCRYQLRPLSDNLAEDFLLAQRHFLADPVTGAISVAAELDAESLPRRPLRFAAAYACGAVSEGRAEVRVQVADANDNAPTFVGAPYRFVVRQPSPSTDFVAVGSAVAVDPDYGENGTVTYSIVSVTSVGRVFGVSSGVGDGVFSIDATSGAISLRLGGAGSSVVGVFELSVSCSDSGRPAKNAVAMATVLVAPQAGPAYRPSDRRRVRISEAVPVDGLVAMVTADAGSSENSLAYRIESGDPEGLFWLDFAAGPAASSECALRLAAKLSYEASPQHQLLISAADHVTGLSAELHLTVFLQKASPAADTPEFVGPAADAGGFSVTMSEAEPPAAWRQRVILTASAATASGIGVAYRLEGAPEDVDAFVVGAANGQLRLRRRLDFETRRHHRFWLVAAAMAGESPPAVARLPVSVQVVNSNDWPPRFFRREWRLAAPRDVSDDDEPQRNGAFVGRLRARDPDLGGRGEVDGSNPELTYRLLPGGDADQFLLHPRSGVLRYRPNYRLLGDGCQALPSELTFVAMVTDSVHSDRSRVRVRLLPGGQSRRSPWRNAGSRCLASSSRGPPTLCARLIQHAKIPENAPVGLSILRVAPASSSAGNSSSDDSNRAVYRLIGDEANRLLSLDSSTGELTLRSALDRERERQLDVLVDAITADASRRQVCHVVVTVANINDNLPHFDFQQADVILQAPATSADSVDVFRLRARDADHPRRPVGRFELATTGDSAEGFQLDATSGRVTFVPASAEFRQLPKTRILEFFAVDFELPHSRSASPFRLAVHFSDGNDTATDAAVLAGLTCQPPSWSDVRLSEATPLGASLAVCRVAASSAVRLEVRVSDGPGGEFFEAAGDSSDSVDGVGGGSSFRLRLRRRLNGTATPYGLTVAATVRVKSTSPTSQSDIAVATAALTVGYNLEVDIARPPVFESAAYSLLVREDAAPGEPLLPLRAQDPGADFQLTYRLANIENDSVAGSGVEAFSINPATGQLRLRRRLDRESLPNATLRFLAFAADSAGAVGHPAEVTVRVLDVNDQPLRWAAPSYESSSASTIRLSTAKLRQSGSAATVDLVPAGSDLLAVADDDPEDRPPVRYFSLGGGRGRGEGDADILFDVDIDTGAVSMATSGAAVDACRRIRRRRRRLLRGRPLKLLIIATDGVFGTPPRRLQIELDDC
ncbi:hypothetical protein BOX15_Mlig012671g3, partial [Macrostomum lignano]